MTIDHLSFGTHDLQRTRRFYEEQLGFPIVIHERMLVAQGGRIEHIFFDCGGGCCIAFMEHQGVPGVAADYATGINAGLGVPPGTYHFAFRCDSLEALHARRAELLSRGVVLGEVVDLHPYRSFFFNDPNGLRLEYTVRVAPFVASDKDPEQRQFPVDLKLFSRSAGVQEDAE